MKILSTILSAALLAGTCAVAMAQGAGGDVNPNQIGRGADGNPSSPWANPMAGNRGNTMQARDGQYGYGEYGYRQGMRSSNVSGTWNSGWNNGRGDRMNMNTMRSSNVSGTWNNSSTPSMAPTGRW
jgi:hypothetical protein